MDISVPLIYSYCFRKPSDAVLGQCHLNPVKNTKEKKWRMPKTRLHIYNNNSNNRTREIAYESKFTYSNP